MAEDQNGAVSFAGAGAAPNASANGAQPPAQETQKEQQPVYLTRDEALHLVQEEVKRRVQSFTDKAMSRVEKVLAAAQQQGLNLTNQQAERIADAIEAEARPAAGTGKATPPAQSENQATVHPVVLAAEAIQQRAGVAIEGNDPEFAMIDRETMDEVEFLASVKRAVEAKKARLAQAGSPARIAAQGIGAGGQASGKVQLTAELQRLLTAPQKNWAEIRRVKQELSKYNT